MDRLLVDLDAAELTRPLGADELADLRWYLEDYLQAPFGVYEERGARIAGRLAGWGEAMFTGLFGSGPARDAYVSIRTQGRAPAEIMVRSGRPEWLGLPWELLRDPHLPAPLVLEGVKVSRGLPGPDSSEVCEVAGQRMRVLMVISRPYGGQDVGYRMIARPLLHRLDAVRGKVELEVLRPPTLQALAEVLRSARQEGAPFQIVHFDGHGALTDGRGVLVFEKPGANGVDRVSADRLAEVLAEAEVPVVVVNACQSGAVGKRLEAAVATQLLAGGAEAVVAMAYKVYAVAAAEFMADFYERLFAGETIGDAVRAGRTRLAQRPGRPSPKGDLPLEDWSVPVHYLRREVRFPQLSATPAAKAESAPADPLESDEDFVGRDSLFFALEAATATNQVILVHGVAGTGKTELAKAFGRWWRDTGGADRPEWVLWQSFQAFSGLAGVISELGLRLFGSDFARNDRDRRRELLCDFLRANKLLLIWDNFESVTSMPAAAAADNAELADFLDRIAGGRSTILMTSRSPETWLGEVCRLAVGGLTRAEAIEYAGQLLDPIPSAAPRRADRAFGELLEWLHGHPLSMRLVLPHLAVTDAATLLSGLRGTHPLPGDLGNGVDDRLPASISYSIAHLDAADCRLLAAVAMFDGVVVAAMLSLFARISYVPQRFRDVGIDQWTGMLDRATHVGLLTAHGGGVYGIHPALPSYLTGQWRAENPDDYPAERTAAELALIDAYAAFARELAGRMETRHAASAHQVVDLHRRTMSRMLGSALDNQLWSQASLMVSVLHAFLEHRGLTSEALDWLDRCMLALDSAPAPGPVVGMFRLYLVDHRAEHLIRAGDLNAAQTACVEAIEALPAGQTDEFVAKIHGRLGRLAQWRSRWDEAEQWYRTELAAYEELGSKRAIAIACGKLGSLAQDRARWDEAGQWLRRALAINQELGNQAGIAFTFGRLGDVAQDQGSWDEAEQFYRSSLEVAQEIGNEDDTARSCHKLGMVAFKRGRLAAAGQWYRQSLAIAEKLGDSYARAASYHQLGSLAQRRGELDEAEQWYRQSLELSQQLGDRNRDASTYQALGGLALTRQQTDEATQSFRKAIAIWEELGKQREVAATYSMLSLVMQLRGELTEAEECCRNALAIQEALNDRVAIGGSYLILGRLAGIRGNNDEALEWTIRSVALYEQFLDPEQAAPLARQLAELADRLGTQTVQQHWERVTGTAMPAHIRDLLD